MVNARTRTVLIESAIAAFHSEVKLGPEFVCTCCHRMMYRKSVVACNKVKYTKTSTDVLRKVFSPDYSYISFGGKEWICKTCDRALRRGYMPVQAKANGLQLSDVPPELSGLNPLELRLICLRLPFMKMVALPSGKQRSIHGPAVNVPSKVDTICNVQPRLPLQIELVPMKLKRKLTYKGHYMYDYITPQKPLIALTFLKAKNPLYSDVEVNEDWFDQALANDEELCKYLVEHTDQDMDTEREEHDGGQRAGSANNSACDVSTTEHMECSPGISEDNDSFSVALHELEAKAHQSGFSIHDVPYDGNCMFSALSYQLQSIGVSNSDELRQMVANYLESNAASYCNFVSQPVVSHDAYNADTQSPDVEDEYIINNIADPQLQVRLRWEKYLRCLRNGAWGDHITIQGIADMLSVKINVLSSHGHMLSLIPAKCNAEFEVFVGLIMQCHYVGLDRVSSCHSNVTKNVYNVPNIAGQITFISEPNTDSHDTEAVEDTLDDSIVEEGDEHTKQITGGPQASMLSVENPEAFKDIICIAPAEGQKPLNVMTDPNFEAMSNPDKFPYAEGTFSTDN